MLFGFYRLDMMCIGAYLAFKTNSKSLHKFSLDLDVEFDQKFSLDLNVEFDHDFRLDFDMWPHASLFAAFVIFCRLCAPLFAATVWSFLPHAASSSAFVWSVRPCACTTFEVRQRLRDALTIWHTARPTASKSPPS